MSDAPAEQHVELHSAPAANLTQPRHIEGLRERHHRHWRFHPQLKCYRPIGLLGIDFLFHLTTSYYLDVVYGCKVTNKRAKYQIKFEYFLEYYRAKLKGTHYFSKKN
jgi:hypothetical protein